MPRFMLVAAVTILASFVIGAEPKREPPRIGKPGELTRAEEDKLDALMQRYILHDMCICSDEEAVKAVERLGPEAIPGLIRGLNKAADITHDCPVAKIAKKLRRLLMSSKDSEVLEFARENIGAGVRSRKHQGILNELKVAIMFRKRALYEMQAAERRKQPGSRSVPSAARRR